VRGYVPEREEGQGLVEYALILVLIAIVCIAGLIVMGPKIASFFTALGSSV
jgi:pilus assembly protein Flp/PilA